MEGGTDRTEKIEKHLREEREVKEATITILEEERASTKRLEKAERLKEAWKKKSELEVYLSMVRKLEMLDAG